MSTRSAIGYELHDGVIQAIYCHHDGYLTDVGKTLIENYDFLKLTDIIDLGNLSTLGTDESNSEFYGRDRQENNTDATEVINRLDLVNTFSDCEYFYLMSVNDEWLVATRDLNNPANFKSLEQALQSENILYTPYKFIDDDEMFNALDTVVDLVRSGKVDPLVMIKHLLDHIDNDIVKGMLDTFFPEHS